MAELEPLKLIDDELKINIEDSNKNICHTIVFVKNDENIEKLYRFKRYLIDVKESIDDESEEVLKKPRELLQTRTNELFGDGTFEALYKINPFVISVANYLFEAIVRIVENISNAQLDEVYDKHGK